MSRETFFHQPVLLSQVLDTFDFSRVTAPKLIDGTVGGGGHSAALLQRWEKLSILGIDRDRDALNAAGERLASFGDRVKLVRGDFADLVSLAAGHGWSDVDGILLDIGVSSPQLDRAERGFSWRQDGPLDMRMDDRNLLTAARWLNRTGEAELIRVFREYGELKSAGKLAGAVIAFREKRPFARTADLVAVCDEVLGKAKPGKLPHPTLVFQAVRIAVNDELGQLERALAAGCGILASGGRIAVISFHSLEDRIVKNYFRRESSECLCPPGLPVCCCGHHASMRLVLKHAVSAEAGEVRANSRSACAKLRIAEKI